MFKNYLTIAIRNLLKHKTYALINIFGLAIGMTCVILTSLFVQHELSYDRHHTKSDRIYRINRSIQAQTGDPAWSPTTSGQLGPTLVENLPEVEETARLFLLSRGALVQYRDITFNQVGVFADPTIFNIFTIPFVKGDPQTALQNAYSLIITESMAQRYFGDEDPIGKPIKILDNFLRGDYHVTAVIKDCPKTTTLFFDYITATLPSHMQRALDSWGSPASQYRNFQTYVLLRKGSDPRQLEPKVQNIAAQYMGEEIRKTTTFQLQALTRMYLHGQEDTGRRLTGYGDITHVYMFAIVGVFVLFIGCINFMNLSTARSGNRAREVGVRKVVGAYRTQLIQQFLCESTLLALLALCLAIALTALTLPAYNQFMGKEFQLNFSQLPILVSLVGLSLIVGILSGSYPALYLSAFRPIAVLKGIIASKTGRIKFRSGLVVFQFAISIILIVGTLTVSNQLNYIQNKNLGFDQAGIISMDLFWKSRGLSRRYHTVKQVFLTHPNIHQATITRFPQGNYITMGTFRAEDHQETYQMGVFDVDEDFLSFFSIDLISGRDFRFEDNLGQDGAKIMLNETAVKMLGWQDPIGKKIGDVRNPWGTVVGIIKDFHVWPLHRKIEPVVFTMRPTSAKHLYLKLGNQNIPGTLQFVESKWKEFLPNHPFEFKFLDHNLTQARYQNEIRLSKIVLVLSFLAIFIACLGLLSLIAFMAEQRTKEIGIRKVLGASTLSIIHILIKDFLLLVLAANLIAWPIAYYALESWLQNFAYRTHLGFTTFALSGLLALLIALATITTQATKAARSNPIDALRYE